jgi:hypothetical protein
MREDLASHDAIDDFFGSDFDRFVNYAVQATLLRLLFRPDPFQEKKGRKKLEFQDLPESVKSNICLRRDEEYLAADKDLADHRLRVSIPNWAGLEFYGPYGQFIRVTSKYGNVEIQWQVSFLTRSLYTQVYVSLLGMENEPRTHDFQIDLSMLYECRYSWMHSRSLDEYAGWMLEVKERFQQLDWKKTQELLTLFIMKSVVKELMGSKMVIDVKDLSTYKVGTTKYVPPNPRCT